MNNNETAEKSPLEQLKDRFPNLVPTTSGSDIENEDYIIRECDGLLTLAEMFDLQDKVFQIGIHGVVPVMYFAVGDKNQTEGDTAKVVEKVYNKQITYKGMVYDIFEFENWDPHDFPAFKKLADFLDNPEGFEAQRSAGFAGNWQLIMKYPAKT